jgi:hypothetical protein
MDREAMQRQLDELRARVRVMEAELAASEAGQPPEWPPRHFYTTYYVLGGFVLGMFGAATSLVFNIVGSLIVHQHPLQLIRVYLTFPLGDQALEMDSDLALAVGCCLYLFTGMVLGIPFHVVLGRWFPNASFGTRFAVVTVLALALWLTNFYLLLSWLQPLLIPGRHHIVAEIPWWVAAPTHLVFGWTMLLVQPLGKFVVAANVAPVSS